jgi:hypothetical protein
LNFAYVKQFLVLPPSAYDDHRLRSFIRSRILELTYTAWDMEPFACDLGDDGPPFRWDEERRFLMRAELDAAFFHLYGIDRDDVDYIMETFPIVKRKDIAAHGTYRTKDKILEIYDAMARAKSADIAYQTELTPPPATAPATLPCDYVSMFHRDSIARSCLAKPIKCARARERARS